MERQVLLAHSARFGYPEQSYREHVSEVLRMASAFASEVAPYTLHAELLLSTVRAAAVYHDLGKVDEVNQNVLHKKVFQSEKVEYLPIDHQDAGTAYLLLKRSIPPALCVRCHHAGLLSGPEENSKNYPFRVRTYPQNGEKTVREITDEKLEEYVSKHEAEIGLTLGLPEGPAPGPTFLRLALSCLVDADHTDTACHYGRMPKKDAPRLRAADRLELLDSHIRFLSKSKGDERTVLRNEVYRACRNAPTEPNLYTCDSPVGTGKTTAVMAHLLHAAAEKGLRRIFVVLPFTNIIDQSVEVYRRSLVGIGERPEDVVAAHHHRTEFEDIQSRQFAFLWEAPIVVTTAVQFFETLASNHPAALRKLHEVPGSAVFIDEAHAALPSHLWPQAWRWLRELESEWGCHLVLGSGSLNRFWELEEFSYPPVGKSDIPELVSTETRSRALKYESNRIKYRTRADLLGLDELIRWVTEVEGPRLLIVNTVQSAAVIAAEIATQLGPDRVEHLSTSLCPRDRKATLNRVKARLQDKGDSDWALVATSCVEAGVDLSFRTAMRERCSLNSLIQVGGRVNRKGEYENAEVWDFQLLFEGLLRPHPAFDTSSRVLGELFAENLVNPKSCTTAMLREVRSKNTVMARNNPIVKAELAGKFPVVADEFKVIDSDTVTAIVDQDLVERLERREVIDRNSLQMLSVQIWWHQKENWALKPVEGFPGLYFWPLQYDEFLGYMAGVLQMETLKRQGISIV